MIVTVRCFYSAGRPKPKPKMGDRRTTKKHGEQVRVPVVVRHGPYRGAWVVRSGRQCYEWVSPEEAYKQWPHLRPAGVATGGALPDPKLCPRCCQYHGPVCPAGVATDQPAGWHVSFDGGLTWEYHADDPWGRLGERAAIVRPLIYGDGADWRTAGVATNQPNRKDGRG